MVEVPVVVDPRIVSPTIVIPHNIARSLRVNHGDIVLVASEKGDVAAAFAMVGYNDAYVRISEHLYESIGPLGRGYVRIKKLGRACPLEQAILGVTDINVNVKKVLNFYAGFPVVIGQKLILDDTIVHVVGCKPKHYGIITTDTKYAVVLEHENIR